MTPEAISSARVNRFAAMYVVSPDGCWIWCGGKGGNNDYGLFRVGRRMVGAHRFSYVAHTGKRIPNGFDIHHLCNEPRCVNWRHLEPVSPAVNQAYRRRRKCRRHHVALKRVAGRRRCRKCHNERNRAYRARIRQRRQAMRRAA